VDARIQSSLRNSINASFVWEDEDGEDHHWTHHIPAVPREGERFTINYGDGSGDAEPSIRLVVDEVSWDFDNTPGGTYVQIHASLARR